MTLEQLEIRCEDLTRVIDAYLNQGKAPLPEICHALNKVLIQILFTPEIEPNLGPNVLLFDQNKRCKALYNRFNRKNDERYQVISLTAYKTDKEIKYE